MIQDIKNSFIDFYESFKNDKFLYGTIAVLFLVTIFLISSLIFVLYKQSTGIQQGYVYDKDYNPAYSTIVIVNKVPVTQFHPETYTIYISESNDEIVNRNWCRVPPVYYKDIKVGDYISCKNLDE